jgi:hypothetical protein
MPGNNFLTNPRGSAASGSGRRFDDQQPPPQGAREAGADRSTDDAAAGGLIPKVQASPGPDVGVGSIGNGAKPFRLGG